MRLGAFLRLRNDDSHGKKKKETKKKRLKLYYRSLMLVEQATHC